MISGQALATFGLMMDIAGVYILASGLITSEDRALELGLSRWVGDTREENLKIPAVADRLIQSRQAKIGLPVLIIGFACQAVAVWLK